MQGVYSNRNIERMTLNHLSYRYVFSILGLLRFYRLPVLTIGYPPPPPPHTLLTDVITYQ